MQMFRLPRLPLLFSLVVFSMVSALHAQRDFVDSLKTAIANPKLHDTTRLRMVHTVASTRFTNNFDPKFHEVIDIMGAIALKNVNNKSNNAKLRKAYQTWTATYYSSLATRYVQQEKYELAARYYDKSIALDRANKNYDEMYTVYLTKSRLYTQTNEYDKAIALVFDALKYYEKDKQTHLHEMPYVYITLAYLYRYQQEYEKSLYYTLEGERYCDLSYQAYPSNFTLNWKISAYQNMSYCYVQQKKYKEGLTACSKGLELTRKLGADVQTTMFLTGAADMQMKLSNFAEAEKIYGEILSFKASTTNNFTLATTYYGLSKLSFNKGDLANAEQYAEKGFAFSKKSGSKTTQQEIADLLYEINLKNKNYEKALQYYEFDKKIADSTQIASSKREISQQQLKYEFEKKALQQKIVDQKKLEALKIAAAKDKADEIAKAQLAQQQMRYDFEKSQLNEKLAQGKKLSAVKLESQKKTAAIKLDAEKKQAAQKSWLIGLSGVLLLLVLGAYFYYRNSRQKQSIATLEKNQIKQKLLITQMNPHFIFNSVHNIRNLIENQQNQDAVKYLDKFSVLTRQILENSNENYISLEEEVAMIQNYLTIQQLLYNHKFDFEVTVEEAIDQESTFLPPMLTQPFIENAIKHGLGNMSANGKIAVKFFLDNEKLFFEVTDNGKGFDSQKTFSNHKSLAMTITKERLVGYTKNQDFNVQTDNIKDQDEKIVGAKVRFEIPYIYEN
jgi:tetratricopeptide (TPR) repeat protein/two-component sensor histidine kinase